MVGGIVHNVCILWRPSKTPLMARESKESQVGGMCVGRDRRGWKRGSNSVAFSFTVREGIVQGEATRAQTGGQPWKASNAWDRISSPQWLTEQEGQGRYEAKDDSANRDGSHTEIIYRNGKVTEPNFNMSKPMLLSCWNAPTCLY